MEVKRGEGERIADPVNSGSISEFDSHSPHQALIEEKLKSLKPKWISSIRISDFHKDSSGRYSAVILFERDLDEGDYYQAISFPSDVWERDSLSEDYLEARLRICFTHMKMVIDREEPAMKNSIDKVVLWWDGRSFLVEVN